MIIEVKLANYRSIHAEQTLSFVAEKARRHPHNLITRPKYKLLKAAALFGANASGKSNFVRAIGEMRDFVRDSATKMNDGDPIVCAQPYRLDPESRDKPTRFEIVFVTDGTQYTYGFAATRERVHEEWLSAKPEKGGKETLNITRKLDKVQWISPSFFGESEFVQFVSLAQNTRSNALFLSTAARDNVQELLPAYRFIRNSIQVYSVSNSMQSLAKQAIEWIASHDISSQSLYPIMRDADTGIANIYTQIFYSFERDIPNRHQIATARRDTSGKELPFDFYEDESLGTQRLFGIASIFLYVLQKGGFLVIDELDASMHPLLTRRLLEMFQSTQANPNGAQLLFTTHDAVLLDSVLFRRDQIILAEKCDNESRFYSLADIVPPPRSTASFLNNYLVGRYGGTPYLGRAFDDITVEGKK